MEFLFLAAGVALAVSANDRRNSRRASSENYYGRSSSLTDGPCGMCYFCNLRRCRCSPVAGSSLSSAPIPAFRNQQLVARSSRLTTPNASSAIKDSPKPIAKSTPVKSTSKSVAKSKLGTKPAPKAASQLSTRAKVESKVKAKAVPKPTTLRIATQSKVTYKLANLALKSSSGRKQLSLSGLFRRTPKRGVPGQPGSQQMGQQPVGRNEKEKASEQEKKPLLPEKPLNPPSFQESAAMTKKEEEDALLPEYSTEPPPMYEDANHFEGVEDSDETD